MPKRILLGPQRGRPSVTQIARELDGPVAVITAGWQENENDELPLGLRRKGLNLEIYRRLEQVFDEDRELAAAHRERQLRLKQLQRLYRLRLDHAVAAYRQLVGLADGNDAGGLDALALEVDAALEGIRALDRHHLERVRIVQTRFDEEWRPSERDALARQREELAEALAAVDSVVLAGGHVAVLLNRLRMFDLAPMLASKSVVAWSAGAMVAAQTIVLFHDSPPWGAGNAEVLDHGLGLVEGVLPLPDSRRRLLIGDPKRIALLAGRFAPLVCVGLETASRLSKDDGRWRGRAALHLEAAGTARIVGRSRWEALAP